MSFFSVMSLLFGGIHGYRSNKNPIEPQQVTTYMFTTTPIFYLKMVANKPSTVLSALAFAPIVNGLLIYTGHQVGRVCDFKE